MMDVIDPTIDNKMAKRIKPDLFFMYGYKKKEASKIVPTKISTGDAKPK